MERCIWVWQHGTPTRPAYGFAPAAPADRPVFAAALDLPGLRVVDGRLVLPPCEVSISASGLIVAARLGWFGMEVHVDRLPHFI